MPNPITQFQILSETPDETAKFYVELFGWRASANNPLEYRQIDTGSEVGIQGGIWAAPSGAPNIVQLFVSVEDVTASVRKAQELGAQALVLPTMLPQGDETAVLIDPHGMSFGVWKPAKVSGRS
jgi:predicted enzyme related to lactoylglutathione lyase